MTRKNTRHNTHRQRGVAAILSMMFLVILGSLAGAMAIVSQGNLRTADTHLRINRSLAAAETGMRFVMQRVNQVTQNVTTADGLIDETNAPALWNQVQNGMLLSFQLEAHNEDEPATNGNVLTVGPIRLGDVDDGQPTFTATFTPHPIVGEDYNSAYYNRPPYSTMNPPVSAADPLNATWVRVRVQADDGFGNVNGNVNVNVNGGGNGLVRRSIQMDFRIEKKIKFAVLSKSRIMIGRNVMVEGPIGSRFMETNLVNGHPVQVVSDFRNIDSALDTALDQHLANLITNDQNGDNRLNLSNPAEVSGLTNPALLDTNNDGYVDDYDFFLEHFDSNANGQISATELDTVNNINTAQLMEMIDTFGDPSRPGYNDGVIDHYDRYTKIRGSVMVKADVQDWETGAAGGPYQEYLQGPIQPKKDDVPLTFNTPDDVLRDFGPQDFDVSSFRTMANGDLAGQATTQFAANDPSDPTTPNMDLSGSLREEVPYRSPHPYDYYDRPVFENMTFTNVTIPKGTNALFKNCTFIGATFVESEADNDDPDFNYSGMTESNGSEKYPNLVVDVNGQTVPNTKDVANNLRFDGCTFEGSVVSDAPTEYTHVRNKISFTGTTRFEIDNSQNLSDDQKRLFKRSTILAPHYSVDMGSYDDASSSTETVELSGTIVAGVVDMRGQVKINGTLLTTFEPQSNTGPVIGDTSPQFNTTLGYFGSAEGDMEAELPGNGVGVIQIRYDPSLALPDGINSPISLTPNIGTYFEGGGQ